MSGAVPRRRGWVWALISVPLSLLALGVLALVLVPPLTSALETRIADGSERFPIGAHAEVRPAAGWAAQPVAAESLLSAPSGGLLLHSPDRQLAVTMAPVGADEQTAALLEEARSNGSLLSERLENGSGLQHVTSGARIAAALDVGDEIVLVGAEAVDGAEIADYRVAFAEILLAVSPLPEDRAVLD